VVATGRATVPATAPNPGAAPKPAAEPGGTVYQRSPEYVPPRDPGPIDAREHSGSLAGFLLSQERSERTSTRSRAIIIGLVILAGIGVLLVLGLLAVNTVLDSVLG
jgi:hypothetical protein